MKIRLVLAFALFSLSSCRRQSEVSCQTNGTIPVCGTSRGPIRVVTMNAALAPGINAMASARTPVFAKDIAAYRDVDVLCLQEVWKDEAARTIEDSLGLSAEHVYRVDTRGHNEVPGQATCLPTQINGVAKCVKKNCAGLADEDQAICALHECEISIGMMKNSLTGQECINCLLATVGNSIEETARICTSDSGASRIYGGQNDVLLASKWPLLNREAIELPGSAANRVALFATIMLPSRGPVEVVCTHLTSGTDKAPPTDPRFKTWDEERDAQIRIIIQAMKSRSMNRPALLVHRTHGRERRYQPRHRVRRPPSTRVRRSG